ncbi:hypothetical protein [Raineyella fluvialis]|uniref:hypothetical protein n=1 Tax=Raineyella fluvialis TaxID=2662261 RepID=UPI001E5B1DF6|nr:hypothetical protein [Raineyella fluvialis]
MTQVLSTRRPDATHGRRARSAPPWSSTLDRVSGTGLGLAMIWFGLLVLLPLIAVLVKASEGAGTPTGSPSPIPRPLPRSASPSGSPSW